MNLIEQLGGYELAKQVFDSVPKDGNSYTVTRDDTGGSFHSGEIFKALLEYRRQHNIFEVGDWFVSDAVTRPYKILERAETDLKIWNQEFTVELTGNKDTVSKIFINAKHATDAEIKAGRRLPVIE